MTVREKIAEAIWKAERPEFATLRWDQCPFPKSYLAQADAAIAAHLDALKADRYAIVKLPDPTTVYQPGDTPNGHDYSIVQWPTALADVSWLDDRELFWCPRMHDGDETPAEFREFAAALLAAADAGEAHR